MSTSNDTSPAVLRTQGLSAGYGRSQVLFEIDFDIGPGDCVALIGRNGAGKTTLLHVIAGLAAPSDGEVEVLGEQVVGIEEPVSA